jgi:hypothetical protein
MLEVDRRIFRVLNSPGLPGIPERANLWEKLNGLELEQGSIRRWLGATVCPGVVERSANLADAVRHRNPRGAMHRTPATRASD